MVWHMAPCVAGHRRVRVRRTLRKSMPIFILSGPQLQTKAWTGKREDNILIGVFSLF